MGKPLRVTVQSPCSEQWETMTRVECGAFCQSCQKSVIDFTGKTQTEIYEMLNSATQPMCGRFYNFQIAEPVYKTYVSKSFLNWRAIAASVGTFFSFVKLSASDNQIMPKIETTTLAGSLNLTQQITPDLEKRVDYTVLAGKEITLKGKVIDFETKEPLSFVFMQLAETTRGCVSDETGNFSLTITKQELQKNLCLKMSYIGYETKELSVRELLTDTTGNVPLVNKLDATIVSLKPTALISVTMGFVVVTKEMRIPPDNNDFKFLPRTAEKVRESFEWARTRLRNNFAE
ncbi:MAG: carboxypeptidase-like regulatory domain-containing protein [Chitinophagales bacterium]|nr:carboxypeptidase-like regulatory domain-containing protein [Chitinophagales bacterium]